MTNLDFYNYIINEYKLNYDSEFYSLLKIYFQQAVEYLEKTVDFQYMRRTTSFSILKGNNTIPFNDRVKHFVTVVNKTRNIELTGLSDTELYSKLSNTKGIPLYYAFFNSTLYFTVNHSENTEYVISYYVYSSPTLFQDNASHPLLTEAFSLLSQTMLLLVSKYTTPDRLEIDTKLLNLYFTQEEKAQAIRPWSTSKIIVKGFDRY